MTRVRLFILAASALVGGLAVTWPTTLTEKIGSPPAFMTLVAHAAHAGPEIVQAMFWTLPLVRCFPVTQKLRACVVPCSATDAKAAEGPSR